MLIIQSDNKPLIFEFEEELGTITRLSAKIYDKQKKELLSWDITTATVGEYTIMLPLTQEQTMSLPSGAVFIDLKWQKNGEVVFADITPIAVRARPNKTVLQERTDEN